MDRVRLVGDRVAHDLDNHVLKRTANRVGWIQIGLFLLQELEENDADFWDFAKLLELRVGVLVEGDVDVRNCLEEFLELGEFRFISSFHLDFNDLLNLIGIDERSKEEGQLVEAGLEVLVTELLEVLLQGGESLSLALSILDMFRGVKETGLILFSALSQETFIDNVFPNFVTRFLFLGDRACRGSIVLLLGHVVS